MSQQAPQQQLDSVVLAVINKFKARASVGKEKYGTDLDRTDLKTLDWIQHAQEELMDGILYLEKLKQSFVAPTNTTHPDQTKGGSESVVDLQNRYGC